MNYSEDYYEILEISSTSSDEIIKAAYRVLARKYHPDIYQGDKQYAEEIMKKINEAYRVLSNPSLRADYDQKRCMKAEASSEKEENVRRCPNCGKAILEKADFCIYCGTEVEAPSVDSTVMADPEPIHVSPEKNKDGRGLAIFLLAVVFLPLILIFAIKANETQPTYDTLDSPSVTPSSQVSSTIPSSQPSEDDRAISMVKNGYLSDYSTTTTIGDAFGRYFGQPKWSFLSKEDGNYVHFQGITANTFNHATGTVSILFSVHNTEYKIVSWQYEDIDQGMESLPVLLSKIFGREND